MRSFSHYNPFVILLYFIAVTLTAMFAMHPLLIALSLLGSVSLLLVLKDNTSLFSHLFFLLLFLGMAVLNPLLSHNGVTVLFILNDNPITLEAVIYGLVTSAAVLAVLYWFRSFSKLMTGDKLLYILGSLSPRLSLLLSMTLRYIPLFGRQAAGVEQAQKGMGLYKEDNILDSLRGKLRIFSVMTTWALENGIITADSMTARGYGTEKRTSFSPFRFTPADAVFLILTMLFASCTCCGLLAGALHIDYYPSVSCQAGNRLTVFSCLSYGLLCFLPVVNQLLEALQWKFLRSKI